MRVEVVLTPAEVATLPGRDLKGATCVVFDVLRATSTMLTALAHGAARIYPAETIQAARDICRSGSPDTLLGGEREGVRIEGFDLGNSPLEYSAKVVTGRDIVMTTTNGTVALRACASAAKVYAGALLNLSALASAIVRQDPAPETLVLVCAGSGARFALEDGLGAAALLARLPGRTSSDDSALMLDALHAVKGASPRDVLRSSSNGRRLIDIGLANDVEYCAQISVLDTVAVLRGDALETESGRSGA